jgi:hypothetical protein
MAGATRFFKTHDEAEAAASNFVNHKKVEIIEKNFGVVNDLNDGKPIINYVVEVDGKTLCQDGVCR